MAGALVQVLTMVIFIAFGSYADGRRFRIFSILMVAVILIAGGAAATQAPQLGQGPPTPWLGLVERASFYGPSLWILALAAVLLHVRRI